MLNKILSDELGFSAKEIAVYLGLLELGSSKVKEIALQSNLNRTTTYDILASLIKKGVVSKFKKQGKDYFQILNPGELLAYLDRDASEYEAALQKRKEKIQQILPELVSLQYKAS